MESVPAPLVVEGRGQVELGRQIFIVSDRVLLEEDGNVHCVILHDLDDLGIDVLTLLLVNGGDALRKQLVNFGVAITGQVEVVDELRAVKLVVHWRSRCPR